MSSNLLLPSPVAGKAKCLILWVNQESPLEVDAEHQSDSAQVTLEMLGKREAKSKVTQLEL